MIGVKVKGNFKHTEGLLKKIKHLNPYSTLNKYGAMGVEALASATPVSTGETAKSWHYEVTHSGDVYTLTFYNSNVVRGINIAVILDVGHGTGTGGYVQGRNYIAPAIRPIFDKIAADAWKEVTDA